MLKNSVLAQQVVDDLFAHLDAEDWEAVINRLDDDAELADELTGTWLRGKTAVSRYLRAQRGVVTDIISEPADFATRRLGGSTWLVTFNLTQRYRLDGAQVRQHMTGCCEVTDFDEGPAVYCWAPTGEVIELEQRR